jgi:hypothetical protein
MPDLELGDYATRVPSDPKTNLGLIFPGSARCRVSKAVWEYHSAL